MFLMVMRSLIVLSCVIGNILISMYQNIFNNTHPPSYTYWVDRGFISLILINSKHLQKLEYFNVNESFHGNPLTHV